MNDAQPKTTKPQNQGTRKSPQKSQNAKPAPKTAAPEKSAPKKAKPRKKNGQASLSRAIWIAAAAFLLIDAILVIRAVRMDPADRLALQPSPTVYVTPTPVPTDVPTEAPTEAPTATPTPAPTAVPTDLTAFTAGGLEVTGSEAPEAMPYQIHISKDTFTVAILGIDENGEYTRLLRTFRAALGTGNTTRKGTYVIDKKYDWYAWSWGGFTPYTCRMADSKIRIHAPLHNEDGDFESLWNEGYQEIGTKATQGCVRTTSEGAAWVYYNCDIGTEMVVGNDDLYTSEDPMPLDRKAKSDPTRPLSDDDLEIPVTFFTMEKDSLTLTVGESIALKTAAVFPENATTDGFLFTSGHRGVVEADETGILTAVGEGTARILVRADDINGVYRFVEVMVVKAA